MKKMTLVFTILLFAVSISFAQSTTPISAKKMAYFTVPSEGDVPDTLLPYYGDLGVRRVIVGDPDNDGQQEVIATDYTNGGRVHVMEVVQDSLLEIVWSSPAAESGSSSSPRDVVIGDCDGDGNQEIIFQQSGFENFDGSFGRIALYEWNGTDWGTQPAFSITPNMLESAGAREGGMTFVRENMNAGDYDGDGKTEIIPFGADPRQDVLILGVNFTFPGFANIYIEGGKPGTQTNGGDWGIPNSLRNCVAADIDGDGQTEIVNHVYNKYSFWSINVNGKDSYTYPDASDYTDARSKGAVNEFTETDDVSYFGVVAADVNGDGMDEIVGSQVTTGAWNEAGGPSQRIVMNTFDEDNDGVYVWNNDPTYVSEHYGVIVPNADIAALAGKNSAGLWPIEKGDLNKDGMEEIYTGGSVGLNIVAIQYNGQGDILDPESYDINVVDNGESGEVFARYNIYNGRATFTYDTTYVTADSIVIDTTSTFEPGIIDTIREEQPFTTKLFADSVDLDNDGNMEIVICEQSVYDSIQVNFYVWNDTIPGAPGYWDIDLKNSYKVFNEYRRTVRVIEYDVVTGYKENLYGIVTPDDYTIEQNYPNPFNPTTTINFSLPVNKKISLKVYNMVGQEVKTLINDGEFMKGNHQVVWDGTNNFGSKVASGNYIAKLTFGNFSKSIKMTMLK